MTNLIKNGGFAEHDNYWQVSDPEKAEFLDGFCRVGTQVFVSQEISLGSAGGGKFVLGAEMLTVPRFNGRLTLKAHPAGESFYFNLVGGNGWVIKFLPFTTEPSTSGFTVTLEANEGPSGEFGAYFRGLLLTMS